MTHREWFRLSHISIFLLIFTLPIQPADKAFYITKAIWDTTLSLVGIGAFRYVHQPDRPKIQSVELAPPTPSVEAVITQPVAMPVSSSQSAVSVSTNVSGVISMKTDAGSMCNAAKAINGHLFNNRAEDEWQALRDQQALRQRDLEAMKHMGGSNIREQFKGPAQVRAEEDALLHDQFLHPEKYNENGRLISAIYGMPNPNSQPINRDANTIAPYVPMQLNPNIKEVQKLQKQATTVAATALVMMTQLAPAVSSQAPLIASISTEATKTHAVGHMLEMVRNPAPPVDPAMIAFLENGTMPVNQAASTTMAAGGAVVAGNHGPVMAAIAAYVPVVTEVVLGTALAVGGVYAVFKGTCFILDSLGVKPYVAPTATLKEQQNILQNNKTVQNENNGGDPKKPKRDQSETIADLTEKAKKAKDLADEVAEEAKKRGWTEGNSMPKEDDAVTMGHIFNFNDGHAPYSQESYDALNKLVKDAKNFVGRDKYGKEWFSEILPNGKERWAYAKGGTVKSGGTSTGTIPSVFCPEKGLVKIKQMEPIIPTNNKANL